MNQVVSIIVPAYNVQEYIADTIHSLLSQTYQSIEILIVDDGSTDNTWAVIEKVAHSDPRIKAYRIKNGGVSNARNFAMEKATGHYLMFCDSDDTVDANWVAHMVEHMQANRMVVCGWNLIAVQEQSVQKIPECFLETIIPIKRFWKLNGTGLMNSVWNKIFELDKVRLHGLRFDPAITYGEDALFFFDYLSKCSIDTFYIVDEPLYNYFIRPNESLFQKYYEDRAKLDCLLFDRKSDFLKQAGAPEEDWRDFEKDYFFCLNENLNYTFSERSKKTLCQKIRQNTQIIRMEAFRKYMPLHYTCRKTRFLLRLKSYWPSYLLMRLSALKKGAS